MAVTLKGNNGTYEGTSEDSKPLDVPVNTEFNELDTGKTYYFDGETWNEEPPCEGSGFTPTAEQLAAMNSGVTPEDVAQIATNENNISLIERANGSKNVFDITDTYFVSGNVTYTLDSSTSTLNASITNQTYRRIMWNTKLKAGVEYTIMLDVSAIDNPIQIYPTTSDTAASSPWGTIDILATGSYTMNFTATAETTYLAIYLAYGTSTTNDVEIENIMILPKNLNDAGFTDFQPYSMSNAELTAAIKSIQAQLANQ